MQMEVLAARQKKQRTADQFPANCVRDQYSETGAPEFVPYADVCEGSCHMIEQQRPRSREHGRCQDRLPKVTLKKMVHC